MAQYLIRRRRANSYGSHGRTWTFFAISKIKGTNIWPKKNYPDLKKFNSRKEAKDTLKALEDSLYTTEIFEDI